MNCFFRFIKKFGVFLSGPCLVLALYFWPLSDSRYYTVCMLRRVFGIPCPTCGMTRSLANLARGNLSLSLHYHPLGILTAVFLFLVWAYVSWHHLRDSVLNPVVIRIFIATAAALTFLFVIFWFFTVILPLLQNR